ncbi:hypothetical protein G9P44_001885 [Scheffersomyces stipitis]|nr:hypothetical protein G9P44_001885 [Scheffersomyces stipitis]
MSNEFDIDDILQEFDQRSKFAPKKSQKSARSTSSSQTIYNELTTAMLNERMAPELLPYKHELLRNVLDQISNQQQYLLDSHEYGDMNAQTGIVSGDFKLQLMIIETDIERINYLVRLYLRARLSKISKFTIHYIKTTVDESTESLPESKSLLSPEETEYMTKHFKILTDLYNNSFLKKMPDHLRLLDNESSGENMVVAPDVNEPVFIKCITKDLITVPLGDGDELELEENGIYVVKYRLIQKYVSIGDVVLI